MSIDVLLLREGTRLGAADPISHELLQAIPLGQTVTASIRRPRNARHHKLLFTLLTIVHENQDTYATVEDLLRALKLAVGLFDTGLTVDKIPYVVPQSISFASMDQQTFSVVYEKIVNVIITKILPGVNREDLDRQVHDLLDGKNR
jgi:Protein of unknown function (DUF1367)